MAFEKKSPKDHVPSEPTELKHVFASSNMEPKYYLAYWVGNGGDQESFNVYYSHLLRAQDRQEARALAKRLMKAEYIIGDDDEILENLTEEDLLNKYIIGLKEMVLHEA